MKITSSARTVCYSLLLCGFSLLSNSAAAEESDQLYVGLGAGKSGFEGNQFDEKNAAWGLQVGWRINSFLAAELGYSDYQEFESRWKQTFPHPVALSLAAVLRYPVTNRIDIFGKFGLAHVRTEVDNTNPNYVGSFTENESLIGLGATFRLSSSVKARLAYERTALDLDLIPAESFYTQSNGHLNNLSLGVVLEIGN